MSAVISVVVPAYNSEKTIKKCLLSILNQTYKELEVIVVNDGSSDSTEQLCHSIAANDNRVNIITIPNGGVSHARNVGIDNATGDYITFVDSDDYIDEDMYQDLIGLFDDGIDIVHCSYKNVDESGKILSVVGNDNAVIKMNHDEGVMCLFTGKYFTGGLWNKLYKINLFKNVRLDENVKYNEDVLANFFLFDKSDKSIYVSKPYYNYVANNDSSTHSADGVFACNQIVKVSKIMMNKSVDKPYYNIAQNRVAFFLLNLYRNCVFSKKEENRQFAKQVYKEILEYKAKGFYSSKKDRVSIVMLRHFPQLYFKLYKIYDKIRVKELDPEQ